MTTPVALFLLQMYIIHLKILSQTVLYISLNVVIFFSALDAQILQVNTRYLPVTADFFPKACK